MHSTQNTGLSSVKSSRNKQFTESELCMWGFGCAEPHRTLNKTSDNDWFCCCVGRFKSSIPLSCWNVKLSQWGATWIMSACVRLLQVIYFSFRMNYFTHPHHSSERELLWPCLWTAVCTYCISVTFSDVHHPSAKDQDLAFLSCEVIWRCGWDRGLKLL